MSEPTQDPLVRLNTLEELGHAAQMTLEPITQAELPPLPPEPETKDFYLFGVLGAKNVGKSSLVAALLGLTHEPEEGRELGAGTRSPKVFAAPELMPRVLACFAKAGVEAEPARNSGKVAGLEKVAFVDLPDIESRFHEHLPMVMAVNGEIDGLLVVRTAESSFDATFLEKLKAFRRPQMDMYLVMNKFDDWVADRGGDESEARAVCTEHLAEVLRGLDLTTQDVYLTDARPEGIREGLGYDLGRLTEQVLADKSTEELMKAKLRAWVFSLRLWTESLREATDLVRGRILLGSLLERCAVVERSLSQQEGLDAVEEVVPSAVRTSFDRFLERILVGSRQVELAESRLVRRVFHHRVERLPFARIFAAPLFLVGEIFDGLIRTLAGGSGPSVVASSDAGEVREAVATLVETINDSFELERAALAGSFQGVPPKQVLDLEEGKRVLQGVLHGALTRRDEAVLSRTRLPWMTYRIFMWLPIAWFLLGRSITTLYLKQGADFDWTSLGSSIPVALLELTTPSYLISAVCLLTLFYAAVVLREYHFAFRTVHNADVLEIGQKEWAKGIARELYREVIGTTVPTRFHKLGQRLDDAALQLTSMDEGLEALDPEAVEDATRQLREGESFRG